MDEIGVLLSLLKSLKVLFVEMNFGVIEGQV